MERAQDAASDHFVGRIRKPTWRDPRLLSGVVMIVVSVLAVAGIIGTTNHTQTYYVATRDIAVGDRLTPGVLAPREARLGESDEKYLLADDQVDDEVVIQPIYEGQFVPQRSLGRHDHLNRKPISLSIPVDMAGGIEAGTSVDAWIAFPDGDTGKFLDPALSVSHAEVARVSRENSPLGASDKASVQILVSEKDLPTLIKAVASEARITVIPSYGGRP